MAKVYLGDWGSYYVRSGGLSSSYHPDIQTRWYIEYEQNTSTGVTTVYVQPYVKINWNTGPGFCDYVYVSTTINGTTKYQYIYTAGANYTNQIRYGTTQTFTIEHANDGTASCKFSGYMSGPNKYNGETGALAQHVSSYKKTASHTWSLPTINMASSITNNTSTSSRINFGSDVTLSLTRPNDTITHTLKYTWNGTEYTIGTGIGTSVSYAFPTSFCSNIPTSNETSITVTCISSNGTTCSTVVYLSVPSYSPTASLSISVNNSGNPWGSTYVIGYSKINWSLSGSTSYGASISSYAVGVLGSTINSASGTSSSTVTGSGTVTGYVRDSRGKQSATVSQAYTAYSYAVPTLSGFSAQRCNSSGTLTNDGTYVKISFTWNVASVNNVNVKKYKVVAYDASGALVATLVNESVLANYSGNVTFTASYGSFDTAKRYTIRVFLIDSIQTSGVTFDTTIAAKFVPLSAYRGGQGITLGAAATGTGFNVYMNTLLANDVTIGTSSTTSPPSASIRIHDLRNYNVTPSSFKPYGMNMYFTNAFGRDWESVIQMKGWSNDYSSWELAGNANNYDRNTLYFRTGRNSTWQPWREVAFMDAISTVGKTGNYWDLSGRPSLATVATTGNYWDLANTHSRPTMTWTAVTTTRGWSSGTVNTYSNVLGNAIGVWIGGKPVATNTGLSALFIPIPLITTSETNFLINDEVQWVRVGMYRSGDNLYVVDRGRGKDGYVSHIYVMHFN